MSQDILDIHDSEVLKIIDLTSELTARAGAKRHNYGDFEREIRERFAAIGFTVDVNWYGFEVGGQRQDGALPEVTVTGRADPKSAFDPDRQVHEAVHNVLGIPGEDGWIKTAPGALGNLAEGKGGHGHGSDHAH